MTSSKMAPEVTHWHVPQRCQGQIVEYAYGTESDGTAWERRHDRSDGETSYTCLGMADEGWDPANDHLDVISVA